jgi:hypothetical protein
MTRDDRIWVLACVLGCLTLNNVWWSTQIDIWDVVLVSAWFTLILLTSFLAPKRPGSKSGEPR